MRLYHRWARTVAVDTYRCSSCGLVVTSPSEPARFVNGRTVNGQPVERRAKLPQCPGVKPGYTVRRTSAEARAKLERCIHRLGHEWVAREVGLRPGSTAALNETQTVQLEELARAVEWADAGDDALLARVRERMRALYLVRLSGAAVAGLGEAPT